jgi:hypothetical protein
MEEITFENLFLTNVEILEQKFSAVFDPFSGKVISVGPSFAFKDDKHEIEIDQETALMIIEGKISLNSCFVDLESDKLEFIQSKTMFKIDDLLHRIPEKSWTDIDKIDLYIVYYSKTKTLKFQLSEEFSGTKKLPKKFQPVTMRKIKWDGSTIMNFFITEYNDPNVVYSTISFSIDDLVGKNKIIHNVELTKNSSIYTRRIFKNCVMEFK